MRREREEEWRKPWRPTRRREDGASLNPSTTTNCTSISACSLNESNGRTQHDKGGSRVWLEGYGASAIGARLYAALAGFKLEEGIIAQTFRIVRQPPARCQNR